MAEKRTQLSLGRLLWPYAKREISVSIPAKEVLARLESFIAFQSSVAAHLHARRSGAFSGRVEGSHFRMARVVQGELVPGILGEVLEESASSALIRLRFTMWIGYVMAVAAPVLAGYFLLTANLWAAVIAGAVLLVFGASNANFWREVDQTVEQLRNTMQAGE